MHQLNYDTVAMRQGIITLDVKEELGVANDREFDETKEGDVRLFTRIAAETFQRLGNEFECHLLAQVGVDALLEIADESIHERFCNAQKHHVWVKDEYIYCFCAQPEEEYC